MDEKHMQQDHPWGQCWAAYPQVQPDQQNTTCVLFLVRSLSLRHQGAATDIWCTRHASEELSTSEVAAKEQQRACQTSAPSVDSQLFEFDTHSNSKREVMPELSGSYDIKHTLPLPKTKKAQS